MNTKSPTQGKKTPTYTQKNTAETLHDFGTSMAGNTARQLGDLAGGVGSGFLDQMFGAYPPDEKTSQEAIWKDKMQEQLPPQKKKEANVFNFSQYHEKEIVGRKVVQLQEQIKDAVNVIKHDSSDLVKEAEKLSLEPIAEKPGIYHERLLEVILSLLKALRLKIGESKTWMQALISKKAKRGSLFAKRSKEKGSQYFLSEEMKTTRSVQ